MSWWEHPLDRLRARFATTAGPTPEPLRPGRPAEPAERSSEAWREVVPLQRTLAEPIHPVAINDRFRDSLASFTDPSFLAPLGHHVDPSVGGLAAGLVSPGVRQPHGGPELMIPPAAPARAMTTVQRLPSWGAAEPELQTVPLEYVDPAAADAPTTPDAPIAPDAGTEPPDVVAPWSPDPGVVPQQRSVPPVTLPAVQRTELPVAAPAARRTGGPADAWPPVAVAEPTSPAPEQVPAGELPVASPNVDPAPERGGPAPVEWSTPLLSGAPLPLQRRAAAPPEASTLGGRPTLGVSASPGAPVTTGPTAPAEPSVQAIRYEPGFTQAPRPTVTPTVATVASSVGGGPATVRSVPSANRPGHGVDHIAVDAGALPTIWPTEPVSTPALPDVSVSRASRADPPNAASDADHGVAGFTESPLVAAWTPAVADHSPVGELDRVDGLTTPTSSDGAALGPDARVAPPIVAVQRRMDDRAPAVSRPQPRVPELAARPEQPAAVLQPPLVVARSVVAAGPSQGASAPSAATSFARMFPGSPPNPIPTWSDPAEDHPSVQREPADTPAADEWAPPAVPAEAAVGPTAATGTPSRGAAGDLGGTAGNLDEIARRLYEPLAARLREELWLDRERAGLMNDG